MLRPCAVQVAQRVARRGEVAVLERELGAAHQARRLQRLARAVGALEPAVAALEVAHLVRGARREQRGDAGRRSVVVGHCGLLLRARVAALIVGLQRCGERRVGALPPAPRAPGAHRGGKRERTRQKAKQEIGNDKAGERGDHEEHHRHLDAPGRIEKQHVARVDVREQHERHRRRGHQQQPEQRLHPAARVRRDLKPRTASRLSEIVGISKLIEVAESCFSCASASAAGLLRASK